MPEHVYSHGNCGSLYTHLKSVFTCAKPLVFQAHVMTVIAGSAYDIYGEWSEKSLECINKTRITGSKNELESEIKRKSFGFSINESDGYSESLIEVEKQRMQATTQKVVDFVKDAL